MAYAKSNGYVTDNVTWSQKVKIVTLKYLRLYVFIAVKDKWIVIYHQQKNLAFVNKTANINVQNISLYTC